VHNVTTMVRALARAAVAAALTSLLTACGVGAEDSPEPLEPSMVPPAPTPTVTVVADARVSAHTARRRGGDAAMTSAGRAPRRLALRT